ncbi:GUN4 domain-containing protein [Dapis sp. BLCC M229]|uniref:GUN4 domain-containing protein n=1 Tax=Dapis sp. BLCC M229 TaxID=3400188 RepID=UPI003CEF2BA2
MARNWAICVGINHYDNMPTLQYAQRDAELMRDYFLNEAGFEKVYLFTDNSPPINDAGKPFNSQPTYGTLQRFLRVRFNKEFLSAGDNFWFFYSGHGMRFNDRDYLMPADADPHPDGVEDTAIPLYFVTERLRRCGADNVILFLDACRSQESSKGKGIGIGEEKQKGVITFFSCSPNERSYEIEDERIQQGSFTYALLESLRIQGEGNCATVERLYNRLSYRVADINRQFRKPRQTPYSIVEPATKYHLILLEKQATEQDIATLREEALETENEGNIELAEQLWTRVLAVSPANEKALKALRRIWQKQDNIKSGRNSENSGEQETKSTGDKAANLSSKETDEDSKNDEIELLSDKNVDYTRLRNLLANGKWKEADQETARVMIEVDTQKPSNINAISFRFDIITFDSESIKNFPATDLQTIDKLWVRYSNGKFGFSVQKKIYKMLGGTKSSNGKTWEAFGDEVGWRREGEWSYYSDFTFNLNEASTGYLPAYLIFKKGVESYGIWQIIYTLSRRKL